MRDPSKPECLDYVDLTIEGNEDLSVRPWQGPSPFRRRSKITSAITLATVRKDGVIPQGQHLPALEPYPCPVLRADFAPLRIFPGVQAGPAVEPLLRACPSDVLEHHFVTRQRLSFPVG